MPHNKIASRLLMVFGLLILITVFIFRDTVSSFCQLNFMKAKVVVNNFSPNTSQPGYRSPPLTYLLKETELATYFGEPFKSFNEDEWSGFWKIIYAEYPKDYLGENLPLGNRQLTKDEVIQELRDRYGNPFTRYQSNHWGFFFDLLDKK